MSAQDIELVGNCPTWCRNLTAEAGLHAHVSDDLAVGSGTDTVVVRMMQLAGSDQVRVVVGQHVMGVDDAHALAHALLRLASSAQMAEPGLGFVDVLAAQAQVSTGEMALAAGLAADRGRAQRAGGQVLNVRELARLAVAVAQRVPLARRTSEAAVEDA